MSALPSFVDEETTQKLIVLSFEKVIDAGIPAVFFVVTTWWILSMVRGGGNGERGGNGRGGGGGGMMGRMMGGGGGGGAMRGGGRGKRSGGGGRRGGSADGGYDPYYDGGRPLGPVEELYEDIYDDLSGPGDDNIPPILKLFGGGRPGGRRGGGGGGGGGMDRPTSKLNIGIPKRTYLRVTNLNSKYDSYRYSLVEATRGRAAAAAELRARGFEDAFRRAVGVSSSPGSSSSPGGGGGGSPSADCPPPRARPSSPSSATS